jgi:hypothetical protein
MPVRYRDECPSHRRMSRTHTAGQPAPQRRRPSHRQRRRPSASSKEHTSTPRRRPIRGRGNRPRLLAAGAPTPRRPREFFNRHPRRCPGDLLRALGPVSVEMLLGVRPRHVRAPGLEVYPSACAFPMGAVDSATGCAASARPAVVDLRPTAESVGRDRPSVPQTTHADDMAAVDGNIPCECPPPVLTVYIAASASRRIASADVLGSATAIPMLLRIVTVSPCSSIGG